MHIENPIHGEAKSVYDNDYLLLSIGAIQIVESIPMMVATISNGDETLIVRDSRYQTLDLLEFFDNAGFMDEKERVTVWRSNFHHTRTAFEIKQEGKTTILELSCAPARKPSERPRTKIDIGLLNSPQELLKMFRGEFNIQVQSTFDTPLKAQTQGIEVVKYPYIAIAE